MGDLISCDAATGDFRPCGCDKLEIMPGVSPHCAQLRRAECGHTSANHFAIVWQAGNMRVWRNSAIGHKDGQSGRPFQ
jgi:hypothetical protein